jgi:hypothetical protein
MGPGTEVKRLALVIGNGAYMGASPLKNPRNDATAVAKKLVDLGFEVLTEIDATADRMVRAVSDFTRALAEAGDGTKNTAAVFFYAGHGVQVDGENYLLPIDAEVRNKLDLQHRTIGLQLLLETLSSATRNAIVMLDCCRDNPLPRTLSGTRSAAKPHGLANVHAPPGVYIAFATQPHFVALDGTGDNSPFTEGLLQFMDDPGKHVSDVIMDVRRVVFEKTGGQQVPWDHSALFEPFRFVAGDVTRLEGLSDDARQRVLAEEAAAREASYWTVVQRSKDVGFIHSFVTQFPNSKYRAAALGRIDELKSRSQFWRWARLTAAGVGIVIVGWFAALYMLTKSLPDTNIAMGDILNKDGDAGYIDSYLGCRLRCVFNRFERPCVAFSYDMSPAADKEQEAGKRRCFPKYEADFSWKPSITGTEASTSEIMPVFFSRQPAPRESRFLLRWYRGLSGDPVDVGDVLTNVQTETTFYSDERTGRTYWAMSGGICQQACIDLGSKCKGFSYTSIASRCELFKGVRGVLRDAATKKPVYVPGTISGCDDPTAPIELEGKMSECPDRNSWLQVAPVRSRSPQAAPEPAKK